MNPLLSRLSEGATPGLIVAALLLFALPLIERNSKWRALPMLLIMGLTLRYAFWRITETLPSPGDPIDFVAGLVFLLLEVAGITGGFLSQIALTRTKNRSAEVDANLGWFKSLKRKPRVDVFICTYNEERDILERTMIGARNMTYPSFRVWVLDDGERPWLEKLAADLGCRYIARTTNEHAKAGNINNALDHVMALRQKPDFISILDADFVPNENFLDRTVPLFRTRDVGIVQTPQHFINPDPIQANLNAASDIPDEQRYFFDVMMPAKDAWGTAFCCGTSSVIRVKALHQMGGVPTHSVTEDYLLTLHMKRQGWRTVYLNERLSLGLAPEGLKEYVTQRSRWCQGFMQIMRSADGPFLLNNGLSFMDRLSLIESFLFWSAAHAVRFAYILVPILYLLFDIRAVHVDVVDGISHFLPYFVGQVAVMAWLTDRRVLPVIADLTQLLAAREILGGAFVGLFQTRNRKFQVTTKGGDRSKRTVQWRMLRLFSTLFVLTAASIIVAFTLDPQRSWQDSAVVALYWSWYNLAILSMAMAVCIEKPRLRKSERLQARDQVRVQVANTWLNYTMLDVSVGGLRLHGPSPAPLGTHVRIKIGDREIGGRVVRRDDSDFAIAVDSNMESLGVMVQLVHAGRFDASVHQVHARTVAKRMLARMLG